MTFRTQHAALAAAVLAALTAFFWSPAPAQAAVVSREILKTYFETGDKPTAEQFAALIDTAVNAIDDRYLLGLRQYDPTRVYLPGDTAIAAKRFGIGDTAPEAPLGTGYVDPHTTPTAFAPDFAGKFGFAEMALGDSAGNTYYGFVQLYMPPVATDGSPTPIQVQYLAFDDTPNTPITIFAVPEPASAALWSGLAFGTLRRRTR